MLDHVTTIHIRLTTDPPAGAPSCQLPGGSFCLFTPHPPFFPQLSTCTCLALCEPSSDLTAYIGVLVFLIRGPLLLRGCSLQELSFALSSSPTHGMCMFYRAN
jgi:hypothetical protein